MSVFFSFFRRGIADEFSLLYHTLHILLRRPFLNVASLREEHLNHCTMHSKEIHAIHTLYTQTFPHRLMTYQVSYCIYTAATVEAQELKSPSLTAEQRQEVAGRLVAAVRVLQNEALHTPGSGKSLDIIRRLLSEGHRTGARGSQQKGHRRKRVRLSRSNEGADDVPEDDGHGDSVLGQAPPVVAAAPVLQQSLGGGAIPYGSAWDGDPGFFGGTDTGAGFHADAFSWRASFPDEFSRIPPPSYHAWGSQGWMMPES